MGCAAGLSTKPLTGAELRRVAIPGTLSLAWRLGQAVLHARQANTNAVAAVMRASQGVLLFSGTLFWPMQSMSVLPWIHIGAPRLSSPRMCREDHGCAARNL